MLTLKRSRSCIAWTLCSPNFKSTNASSSVTQYEEWSCWPRRFLSLATHASSSTQRWNNQAETRYSMISRQVNLGALYPLTWSHEVSTFLLWMLSLTLTSLSTPTRICTGLVEVADSAIWVLPSTSSLTMWRTECLRSRKSYVLPFCQCLKTLIKISTLSNFSYVS